jgi:hypothetical protein
VLYHEDQWVLPFDLVTVADLERYLASRDERSAHFLTMVPTIKASIAAKRTEAQQEKPFRVLLRGLLLTDGASEEVVDDTLDDLVQWWKVKNTWCKPLNGAPDEEAKAVREITAECAARRAAAGAPDVTTRMVAAGRQIPGAICVARKRSGQRLAYAPSAWPTTRTFSSTPPPSELTAPSDRPIHGHGCSSAAPLFCTSHGRRTDGTTGTSPPIPTTI